VKRHYWWAHFGVGEKVWGL